MIQRGLGADHPWLAYILRCLGDLEAKKAMQRVPSTIIGARFRSATIVYHPHSIVYMLAENRASGDQVPAYSYTIVPSPVCLSLF